ncbi:hypothetical protein EJB05_21879, partial [Eragrostis curvula]
PRRHAPQPPASFSAATACPSRASSRLSSLPLAPTLSAADLRRRLRSRRSSSSSGRTGRASAAGAEAEGGLGRADSRLQHGGKDDGGVLQQETVRVDLQLCYWILTTPSLPLAMKGYGYGDHSILVSEEFPGVRYLKEGDFVNDDVGRGLSDGLVKSGAYSIFMPYTRSRRLIMQQSN